MKPELSILCVTRGDASAAPSLRLFDVLARSRPDTEFVLCVDGDPKAVESFGLSAARVHDVRSRGFIESVLDDAVALCRAPYVLRLDDDERPSWAMVSWLAEKRYEAQRVWSFPRMHLWPDPQSMILTPHLWPDLQTRLSLRELAGGRPTPHAPSPHYSVQAPVAIEHLKFITRSREQREETARRWHQGRMLPFSLPEDVYDEVEILEAGSGAVPWIPEWRRKVSMKAVTA